MSIGMQCNLMILQLLNFPKKKKCAQCSKFSFGNEIPNFLMSKGLNLLPLTCKPMFYQLGKVTQ